MRKFLFYCIYLFILIWVSELVLARLLPVNTISVSQLPPIKFKLSNNKKLGYELRPNIGDINSDGFRSNTDQDRKDTNLTKIMIIGDSVAFGLGVSKEQTYALILEEMLNAESGEKYKILNLAVPGYSAVQTVERFKERASHHKPDIVIYHYWFNDFSSSGGMDWQTPFFSDVAGEIWEMYAKLYLQFPALELFRSQIINSQIFSRLVMLYYRFKRFGPEQNDLEATFKEGNNNYQEFLDSFAKISKDNELDFLKVCFEGDVASEFNHFYFAIEELVEICEKNNIRLIFLFTPILVNFENYPYLSLHNYGHKLVKKFNGEYLDILKQFMQHQSNGENFRMNVVDDTHFSADGHVVTAKAIFNYLTSKD